MGLSDPGRLVDAQVVGAHGPVRTSCFRRPVTRLVAAEFTIARKNEKTPLRYSDEAPDRVKYPWSRISPYLSRVWKLTSEPVNVTRT